MPSLSEEAVRFGAAVEFTVRRVRADRRRASKDVARLLAVIEERLFLPTFDVNELKRLTSPATVTIRRFRQELGQSPAEYVQHLRLEAARYALVELGANVEEAGLLAGYSGRPAFSRAFRRRWGQAPSEVCREPAARTASAPAPAAADEPAARGLDPAASIARYRQAVAGEMAPGDAAELVRRLRLRFPGAGRARAGSGGAGGCREAPRVELAQPGEPHDRLLAEALWAAWRDLPRDELRDLLCNVVRFRSPALFHVLGKHDGNGTGSGADPVAAAEIGLQVLEESGHAFGGGPLRDLKALGWARVGRARYEAGDVAGAERAFEFCDEEWAAPRDCRDPLAEAEIGVLKAPLRLQQRRFDEACQLVDRAIELFREAGAQHLLARALVDRARMARHRDDAETDLVLLEEARKLVDEHSEPVLACRTLLRLAQARVNAGRSKEAQALLAGARAALRSVDDPLLAARLERTEGLVHRELGRVAEAETCLVRAGEAFVALGELPRAVLAFLDLAELHHLRGNSARVCELVLAAVPMVERFKMHRRSLEALRLLKSALDAEELTLTLLRRVRSCVEAIHRDTGT